MIGMLMPEIAVIVDSKTAPPTTTAECVKYALRAEYHLNKRKKGQPLQSEVLGATSTTTKTVKISETKAGLEEVRGTLTRERESFLIRGTRTTVKEEVDQLSKQRTFHLVLSKESCTWGSVVKAQTYVMVVDMRIQEMSEQDLPAFQAKSIEEPTGLAPQHAGRS
ncbi:hypothetical protein TIFTF001_041834 [Ficus carica]|nr:hypothetical protein TIFTF001_041834 [Ficus carica]